MEEKLNKCQMHCIHWAIQSLAKSLCEREEAWAVNSEVKQAQKYLEEFQNSLEPSEIKLTDEECSLSAYLHTMLRKGEDSGASSILYRMVSRNQASTVWKKFIKKAYASQPHFRFNLDENTSSKFEDVVMHLLLHDWVSDGSVRNHLKEVYK